MKKITFADLATNIVMGADVPENLAWAATSAIGVGIEHAIADQGSTREAVVEMASPFLLPNLTQESLVTMVMAGSGLPRMQAERAVFSAQDCLFKAIKEDSTVEVENFGTFHVTPSTSVLRVDSPLLFEPLVSPGIP